MSIARRRSKRKRAEIRLRRSENERLYEQSRRKDERGYAPKNARKTGFEKILSKTALKIFTFFLFCVIMVITNNIVAHIRARTGVKKWRKE